MSAAPPNHDDGTRGRSVVSRPFGSRVRALLAQYETERPYFRSVMRANLGAALVIAVLVVVKLDLSWVWAVVLLAPLFCLLTVCLLFRATVWIPALLAAPATGAAFAVVFAGLAQRWAPSMSSMAGIVGFVLGAALVVQMYRGVARRAREGDMH